MLIPFRAETPNYSGATTLGHFPWATLGMIATNIVVFFATGMGDEESIERWGLEYGAGISPLQWLTSTFLHADLGHLLGNMIFLWVFGLVVEGRLGWWKFLVVYVGLGLAQGAIEQSLPFWNHPGYSLGASGTIYGLLAMALVWAPETEIQFFWLLFLRFGQFQVAILWVALWYIGLDLLSALIDGFELSTELLHSVGAIVGLALGVVMLKLNWVDCEGWDFFTVMTGRHLRQGRSRSSPKKSRASEPGAESEGKSETERFTEAQAELRRTVAQRRGGAALALYRKFDPAQWMLPEVDLSKFIDLLCKERHFEEAVSLLEEYLRRFSERAAPARLKLAQILVERQQRPTYAMRILAELDETPLSPRHTELKSALEKKARKMIDDGVLELEGRAW